MEGYCVWNGFKVRYLLFRQHERDHSCYYQPALMQQWLKTMASMMNSPNQTYVPGWRVNSNCKSCSNGLIVLTQGRSSSLLLCKDILGLVCWKSAKHNHSFSRLIIVGHGTCLLENKTCNNTAKQQDVASSSNDQRSNFSKHQPTLAFHCSRTEIILRRNFKILDGLMV